MHVRHAWRAEEEFDGVRLCAQLKKKLIRLWFLSGVVLVLVKFASVL